VTTISIQQKAPQFRGAFRNHQSDLAEEHDTFGRCCLFAVLYHGTIEELVVLEIYLDDRPAVV
jgi:hypothetical protein